MIENTYGLRYPVVKHPLGLFHSSQGLDVLKSDIMILLLTNPGERVMMPSYGTPLRKYFFEPNDAGIDNQVRDLISSVIATWEPRITIENIEVNSNIADEELNPDDTKDQREHILFIKISFYDPNNIALVDNLILELPLPNNAKAGGT
jgi:phage baseplate assembly protein W